MSNRATEAAEELAAVLRAQATNLGSNDLTAVSTAMTEVRAAARALEGALTERGWGGGVLYGFGDPVDEQEGTDESVEEFQRVDDLDDLDDLEDDDDQWVAPPGRRITYQARHDYVIVDEEAFLEYVLRRAAEAGKGWTRDYVVEHTPAYALAQLDAFDERDLADSGIVFAGGQDAAYEVPITLWEMDDEVRDDHFPTAM